MKKFTCVLPLLVGVALGLNVQAAPINITALSATAPATTYTFIKVNVDIAKFPAWKTAFQVLTALQTDLTANKLTACNIAGDLNRTGIDCGNGDMKLATNEAYTYNVAGAVPPYVIPNITATVLDPKNGKTVINTLADVLTLGQVSNFFASTPGVPGDLTGRVINIHFKQRVAQFSMQVSAGQALAPSVTGIQFMVNHQLTPVQAVTGGVANFVGIEDKAGFTDLTIIASGSTRAWVADYLAFVPLSAF